MGSACSASIIALRSHRRYDRARRPKIILHRELPDLRLQILQAGNFGAALLRGGGKYVAGPLQQLRLPLRDLMRVDVKALRELRQRLVAFNGGQRHLRLECR
jgi:hypothetical protein